PTDVLQNSVQLQSLVGSLEGLSLPIGSGGTAVVDSQIYLTLPYAKMLQEHPAVIKELQGATAELQGRMDMWDGARQSLSQAQGMVAELESLGAAQDFQSRLTQARAGFDAARDDNALTQVSQTLDKLLADMRAAVAGAQAAQTQPASTQTGACLQNVPANLIVVHLATQQLVAYTNGCSWLQTPVTTGQPALPTDRGTFQIYAKYDSYEMISPWPQGSPYYYPPTMVNWAMEFVNDGTFIHSASWEPDSAYGPGSQDGPYASHGCVHVMAGPLQQLYNWAPIGTTVTVTD
ncbi:MAG: L,D-transpeptidase family protein, partial [Candidatus Dormibacteraeota bacterium]|nr:L,D-transpeptidase family protein [Candidatus Dormibacteraeota bacterium]